MSVRRSEPEYEAERRRSLVDEDQAQRDDAEQAVDGDDQ